MNSQTPIKARGSLIERASELYGFSLRGIAVEEPVVVDAAAAPAEQPAAPAPAAAPVRAPGKVAVPPSASGSAPLRVASIDRRRLAEHQLIVPDGAVTALSEEFRIMKRQLLLDARGSEGSAPLARGERILIASAQPNDGKTWCALNLALSMAAERDNRVLLVDADFAKPSICNIFGIAQDTGFMDALADPAVDPETLVVATDINGLSVLPAGQRTTADTEYLASSRTEEVLARLTAADPSRIILFDSPPVLAASPASVLALHVGQVVMVVRADVTTDAALSEAVKLLGGCDQIKLLLNGTSLSPGGRSFGNYYGYGA